FHPRGVFVKVAEGITIPFVCGDLGDFQFLMQWFHKDIPTSRLAIHFLSALSSGSACSNSRFRSTCPSVGVSDYWVPNLSNTLAVLLASGSLLLTSSIRLLEDFSLEKWRVLLVGGTPCLCPYGVFHLSISWGRVDLTTFQLSHYLLYENYLPFTRILFNYLYIVSAEITSDQLNQQQCRARNSDHRIFLCLVDKASGHVSMYYQVIMTYKGLEFEDLELVVLSGNDVTCEDYQWKKDKVNEVLKLCSGLPSAIIAVREVLAAKHTSHEWEMVLQDIKLLIDRRLPVEQIILQKSISDLIFDDLPYHLKPCFLYLGLFPKGSKIEVEHLYLQWMAEGMISRDDCLNNETMVDLAERYLSDLVQRKMVEVEKEETPSLRKYKSCRVHEHMHDHCSRKGEEYFFEVLGKRGSDSLSLTTNPARRMALHLGKEDYRSSVDQLRNEKDDHLRSLLLLSPQDLQEKFEWPRRMFKRYRMLRVLTFERVDFQDRGLPRGMTWPIYLRYLSFKGCILGVLPSSIGSLSFLETLDLRVSSQIIIPNVLRKLGKLVYLYLPLKFKTPNNDKLYLKSLKEIEILENFDTGMCNVADLFEMMRLRHLSTTVEGILKDVEQIVSRMDTPSMITSVSIKFKNFDCYTEERHSVFRKLLKCKILHTLHMDGHLGQIPLHYNITSSLTEIVLKGSELKEDYMATLDKLPELRVLVLQDNAFAGEKMICVKSGFKKLKRLELLTLQFLGTWEVEKGSMPVLSILAVKNCGKLLFLPDELRNPFRRITFDIVSEHISKDGLRLKESGPGSFLTISSFSQSIIFILYCIFREIIKFADLSGLPLSVSTLPF
ncbi:probable disease resistance RF45 isoform X1, partial [Olea europaea subsp. europaea]